MGTSLKKLVVGLALVGVAALALAKLTGGDSTAEETDGIDRVNTRDDEGADGDEGETGLEVEAESGDDGFEADLDLPAASNGMDAFDYLAVVAAGAKAAYEEYRNRA